MVDLGLDLGGKATDHLSVPVRSAVAVGVFGAHCGRRAGVLDRHSQPHNGLHRQG